MATKTTLIPIEICQDALMNKTVRELQIFIWLKMYCSGKLRITSEVLRKIMADLGIKTDKTVWAGINSLLNKGWITFSRKSGYYFIKSFERIRESEGYTRRTGAEFNIKDIKSFKGFIVAAVIGQMISVQKKHRWITERKKRGSKTVNHSPQLYFPIANAALAKILNVSVSTAYEWKKLADKHGFISIKKDFACIDTVYPQFLNELKKYGEIPSERLLFKNGCIWEQLPDKCTSSINLKSRKKLQNENGKKSKHIKRGV